MTKAAGEIPYTWVQTTIGDVCSQPQYGYTTKASDSGDLLLLRTTDITGERIVWETVPYCSINPDDIEAYLVKDGDIVVSRAGSVGVSRFITNPRRAVFASYLIRFRPLIDGRFLSYFLKSPDYWAAIGSKKLGIAVPNVNATKLKSIPVPTPPMREQHRIVAKIEELFSELDKGIESLKTARSQLEVYRQSVLNHAFEGKLTAQWRKENKGKLKTSEQLLAGIKRERESCYGRQLRKWESAVTECAATDKFGSKPMKPRKPSEINAFVANDDLPVLPYGWTWVRYGDLCSLIRNGISRKPEGVSGKRIFRISAVRPMEFDLEDVRFIADHTGDFADYYLERGDLVFTRYNGSRAYVGVCAEYKSDGPHLYPDKLIRTQLATSQTLPGYLEKAINCGASRHFIETRIRTTAGQSGISGSDIKNIPVPLCSLAEQQIIQDLLDAELARTSRTLADIENNLNRVKVLRQSILKKAFAGHLVAQDPSDEPASVLLEKIRTERAEAGKSGPTARKNRKAKTAA